ncbi:hypothetical protein [Sinorhizobium alkalisoli]|uniref:hypothetical protein n=1 Tax=Sinorhizobium alkalisoli TaxID=1752398 RepID=UPI001041EA26|nr:hypothetical protein [Sinorhizobium alkalisoli]MCA1491087.1 hypothetical protein [Ensifer sp. NBAIM29]
MAHQLHRRSALESDSTAQAAAPDTAERVVSDSRQIRYAPTPKGRALLPVLVELAYWGAKHDPQTAAPEAFVRAYETNRGGLIQSIETGADPSEG